MTCSGAGRLVTVVSTLRAFLKPKLSLAYAASISALRASLDFGDAVEGGADVVIARARGAAN